MNTKGFSRLSELGDIDGVIKTKEGLKYVSDCLHDGTQELCELFYKRKIVSGDICINEVYQRGEEFIIEIKVGLTSYIVPAHGDNSDLIDVDLDELMDFRQNFESTMKEKLTEIRNDQYRISTQEVSTEIKVNPYRDSRRSGRNAVLNFDMIFRTRVLICSPCS